MASTVLITGASSGIGKAAATLFADRQWNVAATMRSPEKAGEWAQRDRMALIRLDVTDPASIAAAIAETESRFGLIDAVVNNAGTAILDKRPGADARDARDSPAIPRTARRCHRQRRVHRRPDHISAV
jgi:NAD(P)-dependent dehydrogenase (short-subunit alcohol dehydrogenase family)